MLSVLQLPISPPLFSFDLDRPTTYGKHERPKGGGF